MLCVRINNIQYIKKKWLGGGSSSTSTAMDGVEAVPPKTLPAGKDVLPCFSREMLAFWNDGE